MKILTLDIETSPHEAYAFNVWNENIGPHKLIKPTGMMTWAAHWKGTPKNQTVYRTWNDEDFLSTLHEMLNEADLVVGYNHDKFDMRHIQREFVENGLLPTKPVPLVDLLKVVKKNFAFPHNKLDYVAQRILGESKLDTGGFELWPAFMQGDPRASRLMERYNKKDVILTERLYVKLLPWITNHPYMAGAVKINDFGVSYGCPACGTRTSAEYVKNAVRRTRCFAIRQVNCRNCGHWFDGKRRKVS